MGRSQVKYNRTHGRAGAKGRGGGGRGRGSAESSSRQQAIKPQGDNAWRYESASSSMPSIDDGMDLEMLSLETQRVSQYSEKVEDNADGQQLVKGINMSAMGKALNQLSVAQRLRIPAYLSVDLEFRDANSTEPKRGNEPSETCEKSPLAAKQTEDDDKETGKEDPTMNDDDSGGGEDDLDAWLDSVIT